MKIRMAAAQIIAKPQESQNNLRAAETLVREAHEAGAGLVVLPELLDTAYAFLRDDSQISKFAAAVEFFSRLSWECEIVIVCGLWEASQDASYDSQFVFAEGKVLARYRKMHLFPLSWESEVFESGDQPVTFVHRDVKFGLAICFDVRFPELFRHYRREGCQAVLISSAFPRSRREHWRTLIRSRAIENQFFVVAANRAGTDSGVTFCGSSAIIDPWGDFLAESADAEAALIHAQLDIDEVARIRARLPCEPHRFFGGSP